MEAKKGRGRPPKYGEAMTGAERTRKWRERKAREQRRTDHPVNYWQVQEIKWLSYTQKARLKAIEKTLARHPQIVKEYLTAAIEHRTRLKLAVAAAQRGAFSPESVAFVRKQHAEIEQLMTDLIAAIETNGR